METIPLGVSQPGSRESLLRVPSKYEPFDTYQSDYQSFLILATIFSETLGLIVQPKVFGIIRVPQTLLLDKCLKNNAAASFNASEKNYLFDQTSFFCVSINLK